MYRRLNTIVYMVDESYLGRGEECGSDQDNAEQPGHHVARSATEVWVLELVVSWSRLQVEAPVT